MRIMVLLLGLLVTSSLFAHEQQVKLAVAANFAEPLKEISESFYKETGIRPVITVGSSGTLFAQISHGAKFDVFLSADASRPEKLIEAGLTRPDHVYIYAQGRLAYVDRTQVSPSIDGLKTYALAPTSRIAIADPNVAPYGMAAKDTLATVALWQQVLPAVVFGKNILQTYQFYQTGNVDRALVAWSLVKDETHHVMLIPSNYHRPVIQKLALLKNGQNPEAARKFVGYLLSEKIQESLPQWGYQSE